jgi:AcrR family transcriptional regulator
VTTADRLVESTQGLLWERRLVGTSPRAIQRRAEVGQGSMYHHFPGKNALALEALRRSAAELREQAQRQLDGPAGAVDRISAYLMRERDVLQGCRIGRMTQDPHVVADAELRQSVGETLEWLRNRLAEILADGVASGELTADLDPGDLTRRSADVLAMQYEITLPANYDMEIIRDRVRTKGSALDDFPGLGLKAYAIRERGSDASPVNQYAPFYLWSAQSGMNRFLWGDGFRGLARSFGRPEVRHWTGLAFERGQATTEPPRTAVRQLWTVPEDADPAAEVERSMGCLGELATAQGVYCAALAVDTRRWELVQFVLWQDDAPSGEGVRYRVLHLSAPEVNALPVGRQW